MPPGGGDKDFAGPLEKKDDMSGITAAAANVASVTVGGQDFTVTAATQMSAGLVEGETVVVNSWVDANGNQIATRITAVNAVGTVYMPLLVR